MQTPYSCCKPKAMEKTPLTPSGTALKARFRAAPAVAILAASLLSACAAQPNIVAVQTHNDVILSQSVPLPAPAPELVATGPAVTGMASWYSVGPGRHRTCSGQFFNGHALTAASHSIPLGTKVRVALLGDDSRSVIVRVNDCMPREGRILDLSRAAAQQLGIIALGTAQVSVTPVVVLADDR